MMKEEYGTIMVKCDPSLYGNDWLELGYWLYSEKDEDFSQDLVFIQNNYRKMYEQLLSDLHSAYRKNSQWDVWIKETKDFSRIEFIQKEELHPSAPGGTAGLTQRSAPNRGAPVIFPS